MIQGISYEKLILVKLAFQTTLTLSSHNNKNCDDDFMSTNFGAIISFLIYGQFREICKLDAETITKILTFSLLLTFYLTKTENGTK